MTERLYKWLLADDTTPVQHKPWPVKVGEWTPEEEPVLCESGWHGVREKDVLAHLPGRLGAKLYVVEAKGIVHGDDKFAALSMRLVEHIGTTDESNLRLFACDVAEDVLDLFEDKYPNDRRPREAIEVSRRYAMGEATREERDAAGDAAWDAARDAAGAAAGAAAWDAARDAAGAVAGAAAWAAAWDAAGDAAWDAARDAAGARYSNWLVVRLESGY